MSLLLAPLHGFTEQATRNVIFRHFGGIDEAVAPFVSLTHGNKVTALKVRDLDPERNQLVPIIPQILGNDPEDFIMLSRYLYDHWGYQEINWNLGCPIRGIVRKKRGSGILPYPELIDSLLEKIMASLPQRLSVKLRLGMNSPGEFPAVVKVLNRYPLSRIMIHPRIGLQQYEGEVMLDALSCHLPEIKLPVVYNGDIHSFDDYIRIRSLFPSIHDFMLGRGVFYNPFLPEMIQADDPALPENAFERFIRFYEELEHVHKSNRHFWVSKMKEFWKYFGRFLGLDEAGLHRLLLIRLEDEWQKEVNTLLSRLG